MAELQVLNRLKTIFSGRLGGAKFSEERESVELGLVITNASGRQYFLFKIGRRCPGGRGSGDPALKAEELS
jgi:hypothetical protein